MKGTIEIHAEGHLQISGRKSINVKCSGTHVNDCPGTVFLIIPSSVMFIGLFAEPKSEGKTNYVLHFFL